jgi:RNase P subunit RPR2
MTLLICEHCQVPTTGKAYRVTSKEGKEIVLDLLVCEACWREARNLGLLTEELDLERTPVGKGE